MSSLKTSKQPKRSDYDRISHDLNIAIEGEGTDAARLRKVIDNVREIANAISYHYPFSASQRPEAVHKAVIETVKAIFANPQEGDDLKALHDHISQSFDLYVVHDYFQYELIAAESEVLLAVSAEELTDTHLVDALLRIQLGREIVFHLQQEGLSSGAIKALTEGTKASAARVLIAEAAKAGQVLKYSTAYQQVARACHKVEAILEAHGASGLAAVGAR